MGGAISKQDPRYIFEVLDKQHHKMDGIIGAPSLGVIRLDYNYPAAPGDIDCPDSFPYDVFYRCVPGLTFGMCQSGEMTPQVEKNFIEAIHYLDDVKHVDGITGDCGFMMYFQRLARAHTNKPVFMSALAQLPAVTCGYSKEEKIMIMTANGKTLEPMRDLIREECGVSTEDPRYIIVGAQDIDGFEAVALGEKVDVKKVTPGMVQLAKKHIREHPDIRAILLECTELPPYADALRQATGKPVFCAITGCNFFMSSVQDNPLFGINNWQEEFDGMQKEDYAFGQNLTQDQQQMLQNEAEAGPGEEAKAE